MVPPGLARSPNLAELSWVRSPSEKEMEAKQSEAPSPAHPQGGRASRPLPGPQCKALSPTPRLPTGASQGFREGQLAKKNHHDQQIPIPTL